MALNESKKLSKINCINNLAVGCCLSNQCKCYDNQEYNNKIFDSSSTSICIRYIFPQSSRQEKTQSETVAWAKQLGFGPPRFEYSNDKEFISSLKNCINYLNFDIPRRQRINTELIVAQAIVESDYGRSRFAREGHNLFGIRVWSKEGMLPYRQPDTIDWRVRAFKSKCESVKYYIEILNTKRVYAEFRRVREITVNRDPIAMAKTLDNFSTNKQYEKHVIEVINRLRNEK
jgi:flagellum-specific peptidoglycan hydrolase FlgJ